MQDLIAKDDGCAKPVGRGYITYPCRLAPRHDQGPDGSPCVAPERPESIRAFNDWERRQQAAKPANGSGTIVDPVSGDHLHHDPAPEPTKQRPGDQRLPSGGEECVQERIIADMQESMRVGRERYGSVLRTFNGRRTMQDVHDEARDLHVYLTQVMMEATADRQTLVSVVLDSMRDSDRQRHTRQQSAEQIVDRLGGWVLANRLGGVE